MWLCMTMIPRDSSSVEYLITLIDNILNEVWEKPLAVFEERRGAWAARASINEKYLADILQFLAMTHYR